MEKINTNQDEANDNDVVIRKNALEEYRVGVCEYQGHIYVDMRLYFRSPNGEMLPTKKGITLSPARFLAMKDGLSAIEPELQRRIGQKGLGK